MRVITPKDRACFDDMLAPEKVGTIRDALPSFFANLQERGDLHISMGHLQTTHRYVLTILWLAPFADSEIYEYPVILKFLYRLWKSNSYTPVCYHSNTLCHGSVFQHWCRATNIGKDVSHGGPKTAPIVGVKYTLCATPSSQTAASKSYPRLTIWPSPNAKDTMTKSRVRIISLPPTLSISKKCNMGIGCP